MRVAECIYRDRLGLAATLKVNGVESEVRYRPGAPLKTIRTRRDELPASLCPLSAGGRHTLGHHAGRWPSTRSRATLIGFGDRCRELLAWLPPPPPSPAGSTRRHIAAVLAEIPAGFVIRARLDLMHWTSLPPSQVGDASELYYGDDHRRHEVDRRSSITRGWR